jgi:hypothetical protein
MQADALMVMALMLGFMCMIMLGTWAHLEDETRAALVRAKGQVLAGAGAAGAVLFLLVAA